MGPKHVPLALNWDFPGRMWDPCSQAGQMWSESRPPCTGEVSAEHELVKRWDTLPPKTTSLILGNRVDMLSQNR